MPSGVTLGRVAVGSNRTSPFQFIKSLRHPPVVFLCRPSTAGSEGTCRSGRGAGGGVPCLPVDSHKPNLGVRRGVGAGVPGSFLPGVAIVLSANKTRGVSLTLVTYIHTHVT